MRTLLIFIVVCSVFTHMHSMDMHTLSEEIAQHLPTLEKNTALHIAVFRQDVDTIETLLKAAPKKNRVNMIIAANRDGKVTPLAYAVQSKNQTIIDSLCSTIKSNRSCCIVGSHVKRRNLYSSIDQARKLAIYIQEFSIAQSLTSVLEQL